VFFTLGFEPVNSTKFGKNFDPSDGLEASSLENECQEDIPQPRRAQLKAGHSRRIFHAQASRLPFIVWAEKLVTLERDNKVYEL
jgi:hypothetical protein